MKAELKQGDGVHGARASTLPGELDKSSRVTFVERLSCRPSRTRRVPSSWESWPQEYTMETRPSAHTSEREEGGKGQDSIAGMVVHKKGTNQLPMDGISHLAAEIS